MNRDEFANKNVIQWGLMEDNKDYLDKDDHNLAPRRHNVNDGNGVRVTVPKWRL